MPFKLCFNGMMLQKVVSRKLTKDIHTNITHQKKKTSANIYPNRPNKDMKDNVLPEGSVARIHTNTSNVFETKDCKKFNIVFF